MPDNLLPAELRDGEEMATTSHASAEVTRKMCHAIGRVPFRVKQHREVVYRRHGRPVAGEGDEVGFVVNVVRSLLACVAEILSPDQAVDLTQQVERAAAHRR